MSAPQSQVSQNTKSENEWTIMVFFAGDPHLSPSMTAQLKALKDAGFQDKTTVLVHYDPNEKRVATTTFEINRKRKADLKQSGHIGTRIGDGKDPFVRNLIEDSIPGVPKSANATGALWNFLMSGLESHPAKHYLIFLIGHGLIVGNDLFLPDNFPQSGIALHDLGKTLREFQNRAKRDGGEVDLIGLHSCSMSGIEVAYELKGAAKYMLATEGISFVTSWPYRQLLKKILNTIDKSNVKVDDLVTSIQQLSLHNSTDFMFSGLSADVCLCSLDPSKIDELNAPIQSLTKALKAGLNNPRGLELITLAHLKAQSYFEETYTDLYDFCHCLEKQCDEADPIQKTLTVACRAVREKLEESPDNVIVQADFFGPLFQYSHGLSIFYPWAEPIEDDPETHDDTMLGRYKKYAFTETLGDDSWLSFLKDYFSKTLRKSREVEEGWGQPSRNGSNKASIAEAITGVAGNGNGGGEGLAVLPDKPSGSLDKPSGSLGGCTCSIKNYPMEFSIRSPRAAKEYNPEEPAPVPTRPAPAGR